MADSIEDVVKKAIESANPGAQVEIKPDPKPVGPQPNIYLAPHVAANIIEFMKRVPTTGFEAYALVEVVTLLNGIAGPPPGGPGVQFVPANQAR